MKYLKHLVLLCILILTCSFKALPPSSSFSITFAKGILPSGYANTYEYNYGQKFLMATPDYYDSSNLELTKSFNIVRPIGQSSPYVTIASKADFHYLNNISTSNWNLHDEYYVLFAIDTNLPNAMTKFNRVQDVTGIFLDEYTDENQEADECLRKLITNNKHFYSVSEVAMKDVYKPVIEGKNIYVTNVNNPATVEQIQSILKATDDVDGDVTSGIYVKEDNYTGHEKEVGEHHITFAVKDNAKNEGTCTIIVQVVDIDNPVINIDDVITSNVSAPLTMQEIEAKIKVSDNVDQNLSYTIIKNEFEGNETKVGSYQISIKAIDNAKNETIKNIVVNVVDDVKPTISGTKLYETSIHKQISLDEIKSHLVVSDNYDQTVNASKLTVVEDTYTNNAKKIGSYHIDLKVSDANHNESDIYRITINVTDKIAPEFFAKDVLINQDEYTHLTKEQIIDLLLKTNNIDASRITNLEKQVVVTYSDYKEDSKENSRMNLKITYDDGEVKDLNVYIKSNIKQTISLPWYQNFFNYISFYYMQVNTWLNNLFDKIIEFFKNLF